MIDTCMYMYITYMIESVWYSKLYRMDMPALRSIYSCTGRRQIINIQDNYALWKELWRKQAACIVTKKWGRKSLILDQVVRAFGKTSAVAKPRSYLWLSSVTQSCPVLCNPMDCSMLGFPVYHQLSEPAQTHVHRVSDAIQPSHPLLSPSWVWASPRRWWRTEKPGMLQSMGSQRIGQD